ncbi:nucleoid-associated protein Lsr2 [Pseudonocardia sp. MH-G8]|nr:nucleoid-associated protein Lsr2 [Pseudonocardia sp. MH-G8]
MAQRVETRFVDDLDGTEAAETVTFTLEGREYEIDLSDRNASELRDSLATYIAAARRAGGAGRSRTTTTTATPTAAAVTPRTDSGSADREYTAAIREWARKNGHQVSERGRISNSVREAYQQRDQQPESAPEPTPEPQVAEAPKAKRGAAVPALDPFRVHQDVG